MGCPQVTSLEHLGGGKNLWQVKPELAVKYGLPTELSSEIKDQLAAAASKKAKRPAGTTSHSAPKAQLVSWGNYLGPSLLPSFSFFHGRLLTFIALSGLSPAPLLHPRP